MLYEKKTELRKYYIRFLPILPPAHRPLSFRDGQFVTEGFNHLYSKIIHLVEKHEQIGKKESSKSEESKEQKENIETSEQSETAISNTHKRKKSTFDIFEAVNHLISGKAFHKGNHANIPSLLDKMIGKYGLIRRELMGRRVDCSARAVIIPDPSLEIDECKIPLALAYQLFAIQCNRKYMEEKSPSEARSYLENLLKRYQLRDQYKNLWQPEDEKELDRLKKDLKELLKGYPIIIARNPILHGPSIQAFYVKDFTEHSTVSLSVTCIRGFGADFDGDTVAIHLPLSKEAREEAKKLLPSQQHHNPANGKSLHALGADIQLANWAQDNTFPEKIIQDDLNRQNDSKVAQKIKGMVEKAMKNSHNTGISFSTIDMENPWDRGNTPNPIFNLYKSKVKAKLETIERACFFLGESKYQSNGQIVSTPEIQGCLSRGLSWGEYYVAAFAARSSIVEKKLGVPKAGEQERVLIHELQSWSIIEKACEAPSKKSFLPVTSNLFWPVSKESKNIMIIRFSEDEQEILQDFKKILSGRHYYVLKENQYMERNPLRNRWSREEEEELLEIIREEKILWTKGNPEDKTLKPENLCYRWKKFARYTESEELKYEAKIFLRSPFYCICKKEDEKGEKVDRKGICQECFGYSIKTPGSYLPLYTPIGMIAAHSVGEPITQLTMKVFHQAELMDLRPEKLLNRLLEQRKEKIYKAPKYIWTRLYLAKKLLQEQGREVDLRYYELASRAKLTIRAKLEPITSWMAKLNFRGLSYLSSKISDTKTTWLFQGREDYFGIQETVVWGQKNPNQIKGEC